MATDIALLRQVFGNDLSDEEVVTAAAKKYNIPVTDVADEVDYKAPKGKWGAAASSAIDTTQSYAYDAAEAAVSRLGWNNVAEGAKKRRKQNEAEAEIGSAVAQDKGLTTDWTDVRGLGTGAEFVGSTAVQSAPQMAAAFAGAGTGAAIGSAIFPGAGTLAGGAIGGALGLAGASLPLYFGANRAAQREQTQDQPGGERTDDATALTAAIGQTGLDLVGSPISGGIRRGATKIGRKIAGDVAKDEAIDAAEAGVRKAAFSVKEMGKDFAKGGAKEAAFSEVPQQYMEEYARTGVDSGHDLLGGAATGRAISAGVGAFALGGMFETAHGAMGRSAGGDRADPNASKTEAPPVAGLPTTPDPARAAPSDAVLPKTVGDLTNAAMPVPAANAAAAAEAASAPAPTAEETKEAERMRGVKERVEAATSLTDKAVAYGVDPKHLTEFAALTTAVNENEIDEETFQQSVAALASGNPSLIAEVKKAIAAVSEQYAAKLEAKTAAETEAANAPKPEPSLGIKAIEDFRKPDGSKLSVLEKDRLFLMLGLDEDGTPVGERLYPKDVAVIESQSGNKVVSKQAVGDPLSKLGFDKETINKLYEQIHGRSAGLEGDTGLEDAAVGEGETVRDPVQQERVRDSDQSEQAGALGGEDVGESGHMRVTSSPNANITVETEETEAGLLQRRRSALKNLAKNPEYTDEQRAAINEALAAGADRGSTKNDQSPKAARDKLIKNKLFTEEQQNTIETLLAHGDTLKAIENRAARVADVVKRRTGAQTEHEKQVRMRQAAEQLAKSELEEQQRLEKKAKEEDLFGEGEEALEGDARTLRIMLMQGYDEKESLKDRQERRARGEMSKQERLIGPSLSDAKVMWAIFALKYSGKPETALPAWDELTPTEQAAFVRTVDYHANESKEGEDAESQMGAKTQELADDAQKRKNDDAEKAKRQAEKAKPEFKEKLVQQETEAVKAIITEGGEKAQARKKKPPEGTKLREKKGEAKAAAPAAPAAPAVAEPPADWLRRAQALVVQRMSKEINRAEMFDGFKAMNLTTAQAQRAVGADNWRNGDSPAYEAHVYTPPKEKADGNQGANSQDTQPTVVGGDNQAQGQQGAGGPVGGPDGEEVQRGGPDAAGKEVPQVGAPDTADATAGAPHGPGPVRGADGEAAAAGGAQGDAGNVGTSDVLLAPTVRSALEESASDEPIEFGVELESGKWVTLEQAVESALLALSPAERESGSSYGNILGIGEAHWDDVAFATQDAAEGETAQNIERLIVARNASPAPLTVTASAGTQQEGGVSRAPSVTRVVRKSRNALDEGKMSPEAFAATTSAALDAADAARAAKGKADRLRGGDRIMEQLLSARRAGVLSPEGVEIAMWLIRQNPQAVRTLGLSIRAAGINEDTMSGEYNPATRIATLIKGSLNVDTATHEILHHLERVMPPRMQAAIRRAWNAQLAQAYKSAKNSSNPNLAKYYTALMDYHFGRGDPKALDAALDLLHEGKVGYEHYNLFNPSEFWATGASRIVSGRYGVSGSVLGQIKQYLKEFVQKVKSVLGLKNDHALIAALNSIANSDGTFTSGMMLQDQPGVHFMYAGEKTQDQEALSQRTRYEFLRSGGATAEEARLATGWFMSPLDNEMKYEFSDHDAEFTQTRPPERMKIASFYEEATTYRLDEVLDHPALFEAYPEARQILVTRQASDQDGRSRVQGWFNPDKNLVNITPYAKNPLSTLVHELQHWVQVKEGFAVGGSPEVVVGAMSPAQRAALYAKAKVELDEPGYDSHLDDAQREQLEQLLDAGDNPDALAQYAAGTDAIVEAYKAIAGEIEARDTQKRLGLSVQQRKDQKPLTSEKIDPKSVVRFRQSRGIAMDAPAQQAQRYRNLETSRAAVVSRMPSHARPAADTLSRLVINSSKNLIRGLTFTRDLLHMAAKGLPSAMKYLGLEEMRNATKIAHEHKADVVVSAFKKLSVHHRAGVNAFIKKSTMAAKWGYVPDHITGDDAVKLKKNLDPAMKQAYDALTKEQQAVVQDVFRHGHETLVQMKTLVNLNVASEFQSAIEDAKAKGDDKYAAKLQADMDDQLTHFKSLLSIGEFNPYSPLKRFGNHVVVGKSKAFLDAAKALEDDPDNSKLATALREMQANGDHYFVAMRETQHEAQQLRDQIAAQYEESYAMEKDRGYIAEIGGNRGLMGMFHRLRGQAEREGDGLNNKAKAATDRMMTDLYLSLLSETSARQSERERKNVAGAEDDMMRAFHSKARADANFLASLATAGEMQSTLMEMEREADERGDARGVSKTERHEHYREILSRHIQGMDYKQSPMVDAALETSSVMQLLTNPAYHLTNLLQPYVMSAPTMAARFGLRAYTEIAAAHKQLGKQLFKNGVDHSNIEDLPSDVRDGIRVLMDRGLINMTLDSEHGANWSEGPLGKVLAPLKRFSQKAEAVNRVATGVAALRLATKAGMSERAAQDYAAKIIYDTHGDYSGFNTPSLMRSPVARLLTQYRKFQIIQISNYARMLHDSFANANLSKEDRYVARKALAYNLSTMFALGGTLGLPGAQAIGAILRAVFGDDDEPDDPELTMRKYLDDVGLGDLATLLVKGFPAWAGVDVSGRLGAGTILSLFPYAENFELSRKAFESYALAATGPFIGGLAPKVADGAGKIGTADWYKGIEGMMPNGIGNILKSARMATAGVTDSKGNTVMDADQISALGSLGQALGLPSTTVTERSARAQSMRNMDLFFKGKVSEIKRSYVEAYRSGDADKLAEARDDWADLQQRMKAHAMPAPKTSDLIKAPHEQGKKDKALVAGVATTKRTAAAAQQLADIYD